MPYNRFKKLDDLNKLLQIDDIAEQWLPNSFTSFHVSEKLLSDLVEASMESLTTEKSKSEFIVVPILKELRRKNINNCSIFSGFEFNVDKSRGLSGYCDFILSAEAKHMEISAPIFCLVEAKNAEIEKGWAQCGAEMYAAQIFNEIKDKPKKVIYGCVTNAFSWCFLKLKDKTLYIDPSYIPLTFAEPHRVLEVLQWIIDDFQ